jgi:hypothetical protein
MQKSEIGDIASESLIHARRRPEVGLGHKNEREIIKTLLKITTSNKAFKLKAS